MLFLKKIVRELVHSSTICWKSSNCMKIVYVSYGLHWVDHRVGLGWSYNFGLSFLLVYFTSFTKNCQVFSRQVHVSATSTLADKGNRSSLVLSFNKYEKIRN